jgi:aminoglycoside 6'-N-acetyltransferase
MKAGQQLQNEIITLEPLTKDNVDLLVQWTLDPVAQGPYKRVPPWPAEKVQQMFLEAADRYYFLIRLTEDSRGIGRFYYRAFHFHIDPQKVDWELNILIADPAERGHGYGTIVQKLVADHLLTLPQTNSVFAYTWTSNISEQRALQKAGFTRKGVMPLPYYEVHLPPEPCVLFVRP